MKTNMSLIAVACGLLLSTGCVATNSGNVARANQKPMPYEKGELAVKTVQTKHVDSDGKTTLDIKTVTETGLQAVKEDRQEGWKTARVVGTAQAKESKLARLAAWFCGPPAPYGYSYGGNGYYGGGYYGNGYNRGDHFPTSSGEGGINIVSSSGGGGGPTFPRPNDGGGNYTFHNGGW